MLDKTHRTIPHGFGAYAGSIGDSELRVAGTGTYVTDKKKASTVEYPTEEEAVEIIREGDNWVD